MTKLHGTTSATQHQPPRTVQERHACLNDGERMPTAPFGRHDPSEQLFSSHAWYSLTMLAALELPDVPFHVLLSNHTATALQHVITQRRTAFAHGVAEQRRFIPSVDEVCQVLQQFYADPYAQHLKQEWLQKQLKIPEARRDDAKYLAELFNTATEDFFFACSATRDHRHTTHETYVSDVHIVSPPAHPAEASESISSTLRTHTTTSGQLHGPLWQTVHSPGQVR